MYNTKRNILVTSALPYANGSLHLGHIMEAIQTDIWARFQKQKGNACYYISADDSHGTAVMLNKQNGNFIENQILNLKNEHKKDYNGFLINFDNYHSTNSKENKKISTIIYKRLLTNNYIKIKKNKQFFDKKKGLFLSDRFIIGVCPKCKAKNQYGDNCEICSNTYNANELLNPISIYSNTKPIIINSMNYFFKLPALTKFVQQWICNNHVQHSVKKKIIEWLIIGLEEWNISRDGPYFGFKIPNTINKYFYVWVDAPIGYIANFKTFCQYKNKINFNNYWKKNSYTEIYHFIGKDIINFHALFWPAILYSTKYNTPSAIFVHGFLTINGKKMSKSKGTFINAKTYLRYINPEYIRYYFACKLSNQVEDLDLNLDDFIHRVNSDLINKLINIAGRSTSFITKYNNGILSNNTENIGLWKHAISYHKSIEHHYENRNYGKAMREIMNIADLTNQYINNKSPWNLQKTSNFKKNIIDICSMGINIFRLLIIWLKPVLPLISKSIELFLNDELKWKNNIKPLIKHKINNFNKLIIRLEKKQINSMINNNKKYTT